jgi:hypothetical protein
MSYNYISELTIKEVEPELLYSINDIITIPIICYHVTNNIATPFLQIMLENNFQEENNSYLSLPYISVKNNISSEELDKHIISRIILSLISVDITQLDNNNEDNIKKNIILDGYLINEKTKKCIAFVNISNFDINYLKMDLKSLTWFALISEIINNKSICNIIKISKNTVDFFTSNLDLCLLYTDDNRIYSHNIPDVCYTSDNMKMVKFKSIFGQIPINNSYYFYTSIEKCISNIDNQEQEYGLNRYAVFYNNFNIINNNKNNKYDIKISNYEKMYPLTYHELVMKKSTGKYIIL